MPTTTRTPRKAKGKAKSRQIATIVETPQIEEAKQYKFSVKFNNTVFEGETNNLEEAIVALKPVFLKTRVLFHIEKDGKVCERIVFVSRARFIFSNKLALKLFVQRMIFK